MSDSVLLLGDCLELMKDIPDKSIDLVLTDPPYGTTACKWDSVIPFEPMWAELKRVRKDNAAICLFGSEPFSSALRISNIKEFKYDWIWEKEQASNFMLMSKQVGNIHEVISVFYKDRPNYYPQMIIGKKPSSSGSINNIETHNNFIGAKPKRQGATDRFPTSIIKFNRDRTGDHPTQKPVALLEYLIKTYTLEGETVLDFTMGSGSTGVACKNLGRKFIGIEKDENYFKIAEKRIEEAGNK
jgi:site-specific DNA-methyltransferase (adenine-specific)